MKNISNAVTHIVRNEELKIPDVLFNTHEQNGKEVIDRWFNGGKKTRWGKNENRVILGY